MSYCGSFWQFLERTVVCYRALTRNSVCVPKLNSVCVSPKSDGHSHGPPTGRPPGSDINADEVEVIQELFDKVMVLDKSMFDVDEDDVDQYVPFNSSYYPDGENTSMYM